MNYIDTSPMCWPELVSSLAFIGLCFWMMWRMIIDWGTH